MDGAGLFAAIVAGQTREGFDSRLRIVDEAGHAFDLDDPYRYGPVLTDFDLHLLAEGTHVRAWERLGARPITHGIRRGVHFAVWAPSAHRVSVVGDFNRWDGRVHPMRTRTSGYWKIFIPDLSVGDCYKFEVVGADGRVVLKADPFGRYFETPPRTASVVQARLVERRKLSLNSTDAGRMTMEMRVEAVDVNQLAYAIQDGGTVWFVVYVAQINEYYEMLPLFEQSAKTFRMVK